MDGIVTIVSGVVVDCVSCSEAEAMRSGVDTKRPQTPPLPQERSYSPNALHLDFWTICGNQGRTQGTTAVEPAGDTIWVAERGTGKPVSIPKPK